MALTKNLLTDEALVESIIRCRESGIGIPESLNRESNINDLKQFLQLAQNQGVEIARASFPKDKADFLEAIVLTSGRPAILLQNNTFAKSSEEWGTRLEAARANIERVIPAVGRIEMVNHPLGIVYKGCGWLVRPDVIVTNSHIAKEFSIKDDGGKFVFKKNVASFKTIKANIDFREEYLVDQEEQFEILEVLYFNETENPDVAFLKISRNTMSGGAVRPISVQPIPLASTTPADGAYVAAIGYPSDDSSRNPLLADELKKIFGNIYNVKRLQPGQVISSRPNMLSHDCSTLGGNSGSVLIDLNSGEAVGLHYGGEFKKENWAIPSQVIQSLLSKVD